MAVLTLRLPDDKHARLKALAHQRGTDVTRLMQEMAMVILAAFDAETRFMVRAARGRGRMARGMALLEKAARRSRQITLSCRRRVISASA